MRVAVTGASGQLGTLLLRRLLADRRISSIVSVDLRPPLLSAPKIQTALADVRDCDIKTYFDGCDAVVHLAFLLSGYYDRDTLESINVAGSKNVFLQAAAANVRQLLFCSSVAAYGVVPGHPVPLDEESPRQLQPEFPYAATKFKVEAFLDEFTAGHPDMVISRVRPAILVGARMPNVLGSMLRGGVLPDTGCPLPVVWDEDVADALMLILTQTASGTFNLAADEPLTGSQLAKECGLQVAPKTPAALARPLAQLSRLLEWSRLGYSFDSAWLQHADQTLIMSSRKARQLLGWKPRCSTALEVLRNYQNVVPRRTNPRLLWFFRAVYLNGRFGPTYPEMAGMNLRIQLCLTGPGGGTFSIRVENCRLLTRRGPANPADSIVTMSASLFLKLLNGQSSWSEKQLTGNILAEGQAHGPMVVAALISSFLSQAHRPGAANVAPRMLSRWLASGSA